jgi:tetratricopeptide (TPR) repeat protein
MKNSLIKSIWVISPIVLFFLLSCASTQQKQVESGGAEFYNSLGTASAEIGQYDKALIYFNKAIEINPKNAGYYNNRGNVYSMRIKTNPIEQFLISIRPLK